MLIKRCLIFYLFCCLVLILTSIQVMGKTAEIILEVGDSIVLPVSDVKKVAVGEPKVADIKVLSEKELMVVGKSEGGTTLFIWNGPTLVSNQIIVYPRPNRTLSEDITQSIGIASVVARISRTSIVLTGDVSTENDKATAEKIARQYSRDVMNLIKVKVSEPQVMVKLKIVEVSKENVKDLGFDWRDQTSGSPAYNLATAIRAVDPTDLLLNKLKLWVDEGKARILAEPTLVTISGSSASFLAGGEVPIPVVIDGETSIQWKTYGVSLSVTPKYEETGQIVLKIKPEVSSLDWSNTIGGEGGNLPSIKKRSADLEVRISQGTSAIIAGIFQSEETKVVSKLPFLGNLPILGELFKSTHFVNRETELMVIATPVIQDSIQAAKEL